MPVAEWEAVYSTSKVIQSSRRSMPGRRAVGGGWAGQLGRQGARPSWSSSRQSVVPGSALTRRSSLHMTRRSPDSAPTDAATAAAAAAAGAGGGATLRAHSGGRGSRGMYGRGEIIDRRWPSDVGAMRRSVEVE